MNVIAVSDQSGAAFSPKDPSGSLYYYWDFTNWLAPGETVLSATVTAKSQVDGTSNTVDMILQAATVLNSAVVKQLVSGGVFGVDYTMTALAVTSLGQTLPLSATLPVGTSFGVIAPSYA